MPRSGWKCRCVPKILPLCLLGSVAKLLDSEKYIKKSGCLSKKSFSFRREFEFFPGKRQGWFGDADSVKTLQLFGPLRKPDGKLNMVRSSSKASGGCSAPIGADLEEAMKRLGKVKFRLDEQIQTSQPAQAQLMISHPNITGMQMDQMTRFVRKSHFIDRLTVSFNDKPVLNAKLDIAISADPNFRFYFVPDKVGELKAEFSDISCESPVSRDVCKPGQSYVQRYSVTP